MKIIAGVDIGNSTTEVCVGAVDESGKLSFLSSAAAFTTGLKGSEANTAGVLAALNEACEKISIPVKNLDLIRINKAAPVIGGTAMETITETIITDSAMLGHNPKTPGGMGTASGILRFIDEISGSNPAEDIIVAIPGSIGYGEAARLINSYQQTHSITGLILQNDEAVLVWNRLLNKIPIIDEVRLIDRIPKGKLCAIEVAPPGEPVRMLSNPYGIATLLKLTPDETKSIVPIAKSFIGKRSGVVVKSPFSGYSEKTVSAGTLYFNGETHTQADVGDGAAKIMKALNDAGTITDITGESGTNVGNMISRIKHELQSVRADGNIGQKPWGSAPNPIPGDFMVRITDLLAVDSFAEIEVAGGIAGETCYEKAVCIAAMVKANELPMKKVADKLMRETGVFVKVAGVEAVMAAIGALTTPGVSFPLCILDLGGGSTDAAIITADGAVKSTHLAGAGGLVTNIIKSELNVSERSAELIKKHVAGKVESLYHLRLENGALIFYKEPLEPKLFGCVALMGAEGLIRIDEDVSLEKLVDVRQEAKRGVFVTNAVRALEKIAPDGDIRKIGSVVLVGGSAEDFEIPGMLTAELAKHNIVCGRGNIRAKEGPRNAVATGLLMSYFE